MIKDNIKIIRDFFKLVKGSKKWITLLFLGSILAHLSSLLIPIFTSNIIYGVTVGNQYTTYLNIGLLALTYIAYNLLWYLNYTSYSHNFKYSYKNLREKIMNKIFTYDTEFFGKISKGTILNTINTDTSNLSEMIDNICEIIVLNKGKIVGQGTHQELMKNNDYYIDLQTNNYSSSHKKMLTNENDVI